MNLQQLFRFFSFSYDRIDPLTEVKSLCVDSRQVEPGSVFFALRGTTRDGHDSIPEAIQRGAVALVCSDIARIPPGFPGLVLKVQDARGILATLAARFYDNPSEKLFTVGVTGTNGKTSITYLVEHLLNQNGKSAAVLGTINHHFKSKIWPTEMTTPNPIELQKRLADFCSEGANAVVMEVSSHALDQRRADSVQFDVTVFSNLTRDHLDYHKTMEQYFQAKQRLFTDLLWKTNKSSVMAVVNTDDVYGRRLKVAEPAEVLSFGEVEADFQFKILKTDWDGTEFTLKTPQGHFLFRVPLLGRHNVSNAVAALCVADAAGLSLEVLSETLRTFPGVPGRLQKVKCSQNPIFVDYAHTPDALEKVLLILKKLRDEISPHSELICVFGCGGDRDKGKRPLMAHVAARLADRIFITSDNPRTESPQQIIREIWAGVTESERKKVMEIEDRRDAIGSAIQSSHPGDIILIAGKGHENYQIIGTEKFPFDDYKVATQLAMEKEKGI
jgi:UDP-N-acetylmuramoyl-L-alanyl-D-glutamate--2,6-diaminopimelate ligase